MLKKGNLKIEIPKNRYEKDDVLISEYSRFELKLNYFGLCHDCLVIYGLKGEKPYICKHFIYYARDNKVVYLDWLLKAEWDKFEDKYFDL